MEIDSNQENGQSENDPSYVPRCEIPCEEKIHQEEIDSYDRYIDEKIHEEKSRE